MARFRNSSSSSHRTATRDPAPISEFLTENTQPQRRQPTVELPLPGHRKRSAQWWSEGLVLKAKGGQSGTTRRKSPPRQPAERASLTPPTPRDSVVPVVASATDPSAEPKPLEHETGEEKELTLEDLAVLPRRSPSARLYVAAAAVALLVAGVALMQSRQNQSARQSPAPLPETPMPVQVTTESPTTEIPSAANRLVAAPASATPKPATAPAADNAPASSSGMQQTTSALRPTPTAAPGSTPGRTSPHSPNPAPSGADESGLLPANEGPKAVPQSPPLTDPGDSTSSLSAPALVPSGTAKASFPELPADTVRSLQSTRPPLARSEQPSTGESQAAASAGFTVPPKAADIAR